MVDHGPYQTEARMRAKLDALGPAFPEDLTGVRVLDVGCDHGWWCALAAARGAAKVVGADRGRYVKEEGEVVDLVARCEALYIPNATFKRTNLGERWPRFGRFGLVLCLDMYHHAYANCGDHERLWRWLRQHTDDDGTLLWQAPLDTRDAVARLNIPENLHADYTGVSILGAAGLYFTVERIGTAGHAKTRTALLCKPLRDEAGDDEGEGA